jgi:hypothetical protein
VRVQGYETGYSFPYAANSGGHTIVAPRLECFATGVSIDTDRCAVVGGSFTNYATGSGGTAIRVGDHGTNCLAMPGHITCVATDIEMSHAGAWGSLWTDKNHHLRLGTSSAGATFSMRQAGGLEGLSIEQSGPTLDKDLIRAYDYTSTRVLFAVRSGGHIQGSVEKLTGQAPDGRFVPNALRGSFVQIDAAAPTLVIGKPVNSAPGCRLLFDIRNTTQGFVQTRWDASYRLAGPWNDPRPGRRRTVEFYSDGNYWIEIARAARDI